MDEDGSAPAEDWLESQSPKIQQKFKHLSGTSQLFEFKADQGRVLCFFFVGKRVILTHGFLKKSDKTPKGEIERAENIKADYDRYEVQTLRKIVEACGGHLKLVMEGPDDKGRVA